MSVLVVVTAAEDLALVRWGGHFAGALGTGLRVAVVSRSVKPQSREELDLTKAEADADSAGTLHGNVLVTLGELQPAADAPAPQLVRLRHPDAPRAVLAELEHEPAELLLVPRRGSSSESWGSNLERTLVQRAECSTLVMRGGSDSGAECARVVVATTGADGNREALKLGASLASERCHVTALFVVEAAMGDDAEALAMRRLQKWRESAGVGDDSAVVGNTLVGRDPQRDLAPVLDSADLTLLTASQERSVSDAMFNLMNERIAGGERGQAVALLRPAKPASTRAMHALNRLRRRFMPELSREERLELFEGLSRGSGWNVDFAMLISLSTALASLGLLQNSAAVVIGAMLVAPLMTPMVGAGLALVQGNALLARRSARAIAFGFLTALCIGAILGALVPTHGLTDELRARGAPTLLDLGVAIISGMAAAYAMARPGLTGALPGVAIAAALVPPISTVGVSMARGHFAVGQGAALLFATNLVAITLGAALTFRLTGVVGKSGERQGQLWVRRALVALVFATVVLAVPLGFYLYMQLQAEERHRVGITRSMEASVEARVEESGDFTFVSVSSKEQGERELVELVVASGDDMGEAEAKALAKLTQDEIGVSVEVQITCLKASWHRAVPQAAPPPGP